MMVRSSGFVDNGFALSAKPKRRTKRRPTAATLFVPFLASFAVVTVVAQHQRTSGGGGGPTAGLYGQILLPPDLLEALPRLTNSAVNTPEQRLLGGQGQARAESFPLQLTEEAVKSNRVQGLIGDLSAALVRSFTNLLLSSPMSSFPPSASLSVPSSSSPVHDVAGARTRKARQYDYYSAPPYHHQQQQQQQPYYYGNTPQYGPPPPPSQYYGGGNQPSSWYYGGQQQQQQPYYGNQQQPPPYYGGGSGGYRLPSPYNTFYGQQPYYYGASAPYIVPSQQQPDGSAGLNNPFGGYALQPQPQPYMPPAGQLAGPVRHAQNQFGYGVNAGVYAGTFGGSSAISSPDGPYGAENSHIGSSYGGLSGGWPLVGGINSTATGIISPNVPPQRPSTSRNNSNSNNSKLSTTVANNSTATAPWGRRPEANSDDGTAKEE